MVSGPCVSRRGGLGIAGEPSKSTRAQGLTLKRILPLFLATVAGVIPAHSADFTIHVGGLVPGTLNLNNARYVPRVKNNPPDSSKMRRFPENTPLAE